MPKVFLLAPCFALLLLAGGCATRSVSMDWIPMESNRQAGIVKLGIIWNPQHDKPVADPLQAEAMANEKCLFWGYRQAEPTGPVRTECTRHSTNIMGTCTRKVAEAEFRCL